MRHVACRDLTPGFIFFVLFLWVPLRAEVIPSDRRIDWSAAGIAGGIPTRTTVCANVRNAPYNAQGDGVTDDTEAIQKAADSCPAGQVVYLPAGSYVTSSHSLRGWQQSINISKGIVIRGDGPTQTKILSSWRTFDLGGGAMVGTAISVLAGYSKGSTSLTVADASSISTGTYVVIDQENDTSVTMITEDGSGGACGWCGIKRCSSNHALIDTSSSGGSCDENRGVYEGGKRALGQILKVTQKNANTITVEPPLYWTYVPSAEPHIVRLQNMVESIGIEDLSIEDIQPGDSDYSIGFEGCASCWLRNIEISHTHRMGVQTNLAYRNEYRDNYFHHAACYPGNYGYGISFALHGTANLVENNIFDNLHAPVASEGGGGGNVIGYNYFDHQRYNSDCGPNPTEHLAHSVAVVNHGAHPVYNLYEGNVLYSMGGDYYWGSSSHMVFFRNRVTGYDPSYHDIMDIPGTHYRNQATIAMRLDRYERFYSILGNVMGTEGVTTTFELEPVDENLCWNYTAYFSYIYQLGFASPWDCSSGNRDVATRDTLLRHGNYDTVTNSTIWDSSNADHTLPQSLYRPSKPIWWGNFPWPPIGPDLTPMVGTIPAQARFLSLPPAPPPTVVGGRGPAFLSFKNILNLSNESSLDLKFKLTSAAQVMLVLYDRKGREVKLFFDEDRPAGLNIIQWDGKNSSGSSVAAGVYLLVLKTAGATQTKKIVVIK